MYSIKRCHDNLSLPDTSWVETKITCFYHVSQCCWKPISDVESLILHVHKLGCKTADQTTSNESLIICCRKHQRPVAQRKCSTKFQCPVLARGNAPGTWQHVAVALKQTFVLLTSMRTKSFQASRQSRPRHDSQPKFDSEKSLNTDRCISLLFQCNILAGSPVDKV